MGGSEGFRAVKEERERERAQKIYFYDDSGDSKSKGLKGKKLMFIVLKEIYK